MLDSVRRTQSSTILEVLVPEKLLSQTVAMQPMTEICNSGGKPEC